MTAGQKNRDIFEVGNAKDLELELSAINEKPLDVSNADASSKQIDNESFVKNE
jgi:hypothetical protein